MNKIIFVLLSLGAALLVSACSRSADGIGAAETHIFDKSGNRLEAVREAGKLVIGISADYAPFAFSVEEDDGAISYQGSDVELGKYIAEQLGVEAEFQEMEMEECLKAAKEGTVDLVLLGMLPEESRLAYVDFTDPYYQPGRQVFLVKKAQRNEYKELEDFAGATVAAQYGTLQAQLVTEQLSKSYMELVDTISEGIEMVNTGRADALALDAQVTDDILDEYSSLALAAAEMEYEQEGVVGGVVEREPELLEAVNQVIDEVVEDGLYLGWMDTAIRMAVSEREADSRGITSQESLPESSRASQAAGSD
ncbi:hypothetical protein B5F29_12055 [Lachnoclostridium sp. An196]|uniref:substrate-binding periplasmic protein n=1 Tax=Lachnoclostridium sp. An196 TaxID=1965583 RepID=UPI000B3AE531|nr:transporter substrate-binding domain-containing protein [Lachnoclostridium sp. An196]OUP18084.1 hypothetical protein B5F29_12055 [Lachnoclostridium sp. An196]